MTPEAAAQQLTRVGTGLIEPTELNACLDIDASEWTRFAAHWEDLVPDPYAAELGTRRLRRYGHFRFTPAEAIAEPMPHDAFVQPENSNPL
jgi:hypothetical protein